jgi:hypothetical protein
MRKIPKRIQKLTTALFSWEDALKHLGECVVQFQRIEDTLCLCISAMIGRNRTIGAIVTSEMSFRARVAVYRALFIHHCGDSGLPEDLGDLIKRLYEAEQERNALVHSLWDASEQHPEYVRREKSSCGRKGHSRTVVHHTPEELEDLANCFEGIATDLIGLTQAASPRVAAQL